MHLHHVQIVRDSWSHCTGLRTRAYPWFAHGMNHRHRRAYDHRIRAQIVRTRKPDLFPELKIPRRTALSGIRRGVGDVVTLDDEDLKPGLRVRIANLKRRNAMLTAISRLILALLRVSGVDLARCRVPDAADKRPLLRAVERARRCMPLSAALRVLRLSSARYHAWVRADGACALDDRPSCPRSMPQRLTYSEVATIGDMVQAIEHRHIAIRGLALHAQRVGKVFAHPATWGKPIRQRGCGRPRLRLYPARPRSACAPKLPMRRGTSMLSRRQRSTTSKRCPSNGWRSGGIVVFS